MNILANGGGRRILASVTLSLLLFTSAAQALDFFSHLFGSDKSDVNTVWQSGKQQYVKIVKRETGKGLDVNNDHPVQLSPLQLSTVLESLTIQKITGLFNDQTEILPLFVPSEVATLGPALSRALERATPDEDVLFLIVGMHEGLITKEPMGTSGRVFYQGNKLHLLIGDLHKSLEGSDEQKKKNMAAGCGDCATDERLDPFKIASRDEAQSLDTPVAVHEGIEFMNVNGKTRGDWLVLDVPKIVAAVEREKNKLPPAIQKERERAQAETAKANMERRQMREEMARMRKEMDQAREDGGSASGGQSIEERLATLDKMKKKGLITDEEYATRRKKILDQI